MQSKSVVEQIITWAGLFKAKFEWPRVSVESDFRFDSFKIKFSQIIFVHNMILWCSKNNTGHYPKRLLNKGIKKPKLIVKFSQIIFVHNMILWCSKNNTGHYPKRLLNKGIKKPKLKFNLGLVLMGLRTTGPWSCKWKPANENLQITCK